MLDLKYIRENAAAVEENCKNRGVEANVGQVVELADRRSALIQELNELKQRQNTMAKSIGQERDEEARGQVIGRVSGDERADPREGDRASRGRGTVAGRTVEDPQHDPSRFSHRQG